MTWANKLSFLLICTIIVFTAVAYGAVHQPILALFYIMVALVVTLWAVDAFITGTIRYSTSLSQIPLIAAAAYGVVQIIPFGSIAESAEVSGVAQTISLDPYATILNTAHLIALLAFFAVMLVSLENIARLRKMVVLITIFGFVFAFFAIIQSVLSPTKIYGIYETRFAVPFGSFVNRHNFAAYMEMTIALPLGMLFAGSVSRDKRLLFITAVSLMGIALLLSGSRGGFVALIAEIIFIIFLTRRKKGKREFILKVSLAVLLVISVIGGAILVGGETSLTRFVETARSNDVSTNRVQIWETTLKVIVNNLPFGAGIGAFGVAYTPFDSNSGLERVEQAHNDYLQVAADMGIVGILIGGFYLFWLFRTGWKNIQTSNRYRRSIAIGAFAGCFAILIHSLFDFVLHTTAISLLFLALNALLVASGIGYADDHSEHSTTKRKRRSPATVTAITETRRHLH